MKPVFWAAAFAAAWAAASAAGAGRAAIVDRSAAGFEVREAVAIAAPPTRVYAALMQPARWWDAKQTFSGAARNLSLDLVKGCFCEVLPGGGMARHMAVVYADGKSALRLYGGLGPLQATGAAGHLGFSVKAEGQGSRLTVAYDVGGYARGGLARTWAAPVDQVLGEQAARLKRYIETGKP